MGPGLPQSEVGAFCAEHRIVELEVDELGAESALATGCPSAL
jgi:hypothetical protein